MTAVVSLFFIATIPIDYKITNFSLHLFACIFSTIIILVSSQVPLQKKKITTNIIFTH